jgi:hypothetical protein
MEKLSNFKFSSLEPSLMKDIKGGLEEASYTQHECVDYTNSSTCTDENHQVYDDKNKVIDSWWWTKCKSPQA